MENETGNQNPINSQVNTANPNNSQVNNPYTQNNSTNNLADEILQKSLNISTMIIRTPISPTTYNIQARSIEKVIKHLHGITTSSEVIGVKPIDSVNIDEGIIFGKVTIVHEDKSVIILDRITKANAKIIKDFFTEVVEFQRRNMVNITGD